jgi:hypothetical protein
MRRSSDSSRMFASRPVKKLPANLYQHLDPLVESVLFYDFLPIRDFTAEEWRRGCRCLIAEQLSGVALRCIREQSFAVPADVVCELSDAHFQFMAVTMSARRASLNGLEALATNGVASVVIKGPSIVKVSKHKSDRTYSDIDVVVSPNDFRRAESLLRQLGYRQGSSSLPQRRSFNALCREGINLRDDLGGSIDLHHHISPWFWSTSLTIDVLRKHGIGETIDDANIVMASPEHSFLIAALHLVSDHGYPGSTHRIWRDLLVIFRHCDEEKLMSVARESRLLYWVRWVLQSLPQELQPVDFLKQLAYEDDDSRGVLRLRALLSRRFIGNPDLSQVFRLPAASAALYVLGVAVPTREFLRHHCPEDPSYLSWWKECFQHLNPPLLSRER